MDLYLEDIMRFFVKSGIYLVIIAKILSLMSNAAGKKEKSARKKTGQELYDASRKDNMKSKNKTGGYSAHYGGFNVKKPQSLFSNIKEQFEKPNDAFDKIELPWGKTQAVKNKQKTVESKGTSKVAVERYDNIETTITKIKSDEENDRVYDQIREIKDMGEAKDAYEIKDDLIISKKSDLKKAIVMKEILDRPLAYRNARR